MENKLVFTDNLPSIDLHGLDREMSLLEVRDFINDNIKLKNEYIVIIHGIGKKILLNTVRDELTKNKLVVNYQTNYFNMGATVVKLKL